MSTSNSFWDHPIKTIEEALSIRKQIDVLQARLTNLVTVTAPALSPVKTTSRGRKKMSAAARARIGAAMKARWAAKRAGSNKPAAKAQPAPTKKGGITPAGRAKLAAAMKARWAAKRKAAGK